VLPPAELLRDCPRPELRGFYNEDLDRAFRARGEAIDQCNLDKRLLRQWRDYHEGQDHGMRKEER